MALALAVSRISSFDGSGRAASTEERIRSRASSDLRAYPASPSRIPVLPSSKPPATHQAKDIGRRSLEFSEPWPRYLDAYLKDFLGSNRGQEGQAIASIQTSHPDLTKKRIWSRIVCLGLTNRKRAPCRKHQWTAEDDAILRSEYGRSRASSHKAIETILSLHPDWSRDAVVWRARTLGLTQHRTAPYQRWSSTLDHYLLSLMDCQLDTIAKRLKRSKKSVLARLRRLGWSAEFFGGFKTKDLVLDLRVPETAVNRWVCLGWLERKKGRITEDSLRRFCRHHADEIPFETLAPETRNWLRLSMDYGRGRVVQRGGWTHTS